MRHALAPTRMQTRGMQESAPQLNCPLAYHQSEDASLYINQSYSIDRRAIVRLVKKLYTRFVYIWVLPKSF